LPERASDQLERRASVPSAQPKGPGIVQAVALERRESQDASAVT
jgi:hypothetical protein